MDLSDRLRLKPIEPNQQQALVDRLMTACGGAYSPQTRRKYFISGPQWAAAYQGQALFHAPTREAIGFEDVIREYEKIGIGHWATHDTDVIPTAALGKDQQKEIVGRIGAALKSNGLECSMGKSFAQRRGALAQGAGGLHGVSGSCAIRLAA